MKDILTTEEWIRAIKALLFLNKNPEDIDIEYIKKIIEESTAGAYELPVVSDEDNGKVLGVENGQFGLVDGGGDAGYECTETTEQLFSETVTTVENDGVCFAPLNYLGLITADELTVIFNGTQYVCPKIDDGDVAYYGGFDLNAEMPDFTNYPFTIVSRPEGNAIATESPMTVAVNASVVVTEATNISPCFASAVSQVSDSSVKIKTATLSVDNVSVDGLTTVILSPLPNDYATTVGVIDIFPLETEDVYINGFDCSGDRGRFSVNYTNKQASPVTLGHVSCVFTYIPESGNK